MAREITARDIIGHGEMAYGHLYSEAQYEWIKSDVDGYIYLLNTKTQRARRYNCEGQNGHRISIDAYEAAKEAALQIGDWAEREADAIEAAWDDREAIEARDREAQAEREAQVAEAVTTERINEIVEEMNREQHADNNFTNIGPREIAMAMVKDVADTIIGGGEGYQHRPPAFTSVEDVMAYINKYGWEVEIIEYTKGAFEQATDGMDQEEYIELVAEMTARITEIVVSTLFPPTKGKRKKASRVGGMEFDCVGVYIVLTDRQVEFIKHLPDSGDWTGDLDAALWVDVLCGDIKGPFENKPMSVGAMVSTLREKGVLTVGVGACKGKPKYINLTDAGKTVVSSILG